MVLVGWEGLRDGQTGGPSQEGQLWEAEAGVGRKADSLIPSKPVERTGFDKRVGRGTRLAQSGEHLTLVLGLFV